MSESVQPAAGPTAFETMRAALPPLADVPEYKTAYDAWNRAAADRDGALQAVREAHTATGRTALQAVADRAVMAERDAATALEAARRATAAAVQNRTLVVLKGARALRRMAGAMERQLAVLAAALAEHVTAAGLAPDPAAETHFAADLEAASDEYRRYVAEAFADWAFEGDADGAQAAVDAAAGLAAAAVRGFVAKLG